MKKEYFLHDHKLTPESPFELEYFPATKEIPLDRIDMHPTIHLGILLKGSVRIWLDGYEKDLHAGDCWLTNPLEPHTSLRQSPDREAIVATFLIEEFGRGFNGWDLPFLAPFTFDAESRLEALSEVDHDELLRQAKCLCKNHLKNIGTDTFTSFREWLMIHNIYLELMRPFIRRQNVRVNISGLDRLRPALMLPRQEPGVPISLETAARACNLSPGRFGELFRLYTGITFSQYETKFRLSGARNDVLAGGRTFKEIAIDWGFYDESHFLRIFRKFYGLTPGAYRKKIQAQHKSN